MRQEFWDTDSKRQRPAHLKEIIWMVIHKEVNCVGWTISVGGGEGEGVGSRLL